MKFSIALSVMVLAVSATNADVVSLKSELKSSEIEHHMDFASFKTTFNRVYAAEEEATKSAIFERNLRDIKEQNAKYSRGESTWQAGVNQVSRRRKR